MRIADVEVIPVRVRLAGDFATSKSRQTSGAGVVRIIVRLHADTGLVGVGECAPAPAWNWETPESTVAAIRYALAPRVVGQDPLAIEQIHRLMNAALPEGSHNPAKTGIDIACFDLAGKQLGMPVYRLLGGTRRDPLDVLWGLGMPEPTRAAAVAREREALKLIGAGSTFLLTACGSIAPPAQSTPRQAAAPKAAAKDAAPRRGGTLKMAVSRDILTFDPFNLSTGMLWHSIYDTLTRYDADGKPQPRLAERWEFGDDGRAMTLHLRDGVKFHNGRALAAEDVVFTIRRAQDPQVAANVLPIARTVTDAQAPDARTVVLRFDQPNAGIFDLFDLLFIQAKETIDTITSRGVGTGPFKLVEWNPNSNVKLARNEAYWQPDLPYLDGIDVLIAPDQQAMVIQLEARAVEVAQNPPPRDAKRLRANSGFTVVDAPHGAQSYGIVLNVTRKPLDHPTVRRAVNHALDRGRFVNTVLAEQSEPWCQPWPKHSIAYVPEYEGSCAYDVERAKALLREAGLASGFETTITSGSSGTEKELVTIVQSDLAKIGINARLEVLEESVYRPRRVSGDFDISTAQYLRANKDPSSLLGTTLFWNPDTGNSNFRDPEYKRLIQEGAATLDPARRRDLYRQITKIIVEQNFVLPLAPTVLNWAMLDKVRDFDRSLDGYEIFERTWLAP